MQSRVPSQRSEERIHWPLVHRNAPLEQKTVTVVSKDVTGGWELESENKLKIVCILYRGKFLLGANFRNFHRQTCYRENINCEKIN